MSARGFPWSSIRGNAVRGRIIPARGLAHNIRIETNDLEPTNPILAWTHTLPDAGQTDKISRVYRDGDLTRTVTQNEQLTVSPIRTDGLAVVDGGFTHFDVEPMSPLESALDQSDNGFAIVPAGNRARLTWSACSAADFDAYLLYWNGGGTATPSTLLDTIQGRENVTAVSPKLTDGTTYRFALAMRDVAGNTSSVGTAYSVTANTPPLALEGATISFSASTRRATVTGRHPLGQHADIGLVALYDNLVPGHGLSEHPNVDIGWQRTTAYTTTGTVTLTSAPLYPGAWAFAARVVDKTGLQSDYDVLRLSIKAAGTGLAVASATPLAPLNLIAYATANGGVILNFSHAGENVTAYKAFTGGTLQATGTASLTTSPHTLTVSGLTNGVGYTFHVLAYNGSVASPSSNPATATADSVAPACNRSMTLELIN